MKKHGLKSLTTDQRRAVADSAGVLDDSLRLVQHGHRNMSAKQAIRIERAAKKVGVDLRREDLCAACGGCEFARAARKLAR